MRRNMSAILIFLLIVALMPTQGPAKKKKTHPAYVFTIEKEVARTPVKDQYRTGTCWIFATFSFLESELLRMGKGEIDLSEMFIARHTYPHKALNYVRLHGKATFGSGGQSHDVLDQMRRYGIVPESAYGGQNIDERRHNHGEMSAVLKGMLDGVLKKWGTRLTPRWPEAFAAVLDVYFGKPPQSFNHEGQTFTPRTFLSDHLGLNLDDYIEITSYSHHSFYQQIRLEVPDNWTYNKKYYNVPIDDLERMVDHAINNGYSVCWDADVSDKGFSPKEKEDMDVYERAEYAIVPLKDWEDLSEKEKDTKYTGPVPEKEVSQAMRQRSFDNFYSTDDHLMHFVGIARDQTGAKFYLTKNSWGIDRRFQGYQYVSRAYFRLHTICLLINKHSLPQDIKTKLGIE